MAAFDPVSALLGGALIGLASVMLMVLNGRIAGISGILGGILAPGTGDKLWRLAFVAGLVGAPLVFALFGRGLGEPEMPANWILIIASGLLVGFGTRLGGGCTSGHGVCGIARLSPRSIVATGIFMASAVLVVAIVRHGLGG
ncbi:MAG: YeeE/YedE family protein [Alphaproteobacteria bacterium]|nr:YeeE/YedE family protein [Alphaproteobacteria bacterium]